MNERIQELAEQAGFFPVELTQVGPSIENLVELIVRECAGISNQAEKQCQHPATQIMKHFGVEE
jgi:hypothetical protein